MKIKTVNKKTTNNYFVLVCIIFKIFVLDILVFNEYKRIRNLN